MLCHSGGRLQSCRLLPQLAQSPSCRVMGLLMLRMPAQNEILKAALAVTGLVAVIASEEDDELVRI